MRSRTQLHAVSRKSHKDACKDYWEAKHFLEGEARDLQSPHLHQAPHLKVRGTEFLKLSQTRIRAPTGPCHLGAPLAPSLHASGEGERVIAPEPWEGTLASRRVEEGLSRSFPG